ncbi:MAG: DUF4328 domain-containing protein [Myxococcota bacterium]
MSNTASLFSHFVSTRGTFRWLSSLVLVSAAAPGVAVGIDVAGMRLLSRRAMGVAVGANERAAHYVVADVAIKIQITLLFATGIAFVTWLYRARANLRAFGTRHLRFSRNWAVFGFVIPIVNLVRPYQVVREVWQASDPSTTEPDGWMSIKPPLLVQAWWATFVAFVAFKALAWWMYWSALRDVSRLEIAEGVELFADLTAAVSVTLVYFVIERITESQQTKWDLLEPPIPD